MVAAGRCGAVRSAVSGHSSGQMAAVGVGSDGISWAGGSGVAGRRVAGSDRAGRRLALPYFPCSAFYNPPRNQCRTKPLDRLAKTEI
jgi:hypothetical protein